MFRTSSQARSDALLGDDYYRSMLPRADPCFNRRTLTKANWAFRVCRAPAHARLTLHGTDSTLALLMRMGRFANLN